MSPDPELLERLKRQEAQAREQMRRLAVRLEGQQAKVDQLRDPNMTLDHSGNVVPRLEASMSDDPRGWHARTDEHGITVGHRSARTPARRQRPRRPLDRVVLVLLILTWLLLASFDTYAPLSICLFLWISQAWTLRWLWLQYREHTAPSMLDRPQPTTKAVVPLPVRLMLLPGAWRIVGPYNVRKAHAIRFKRRDMAERARIQAPAFDHQAISTSGHYTDSHAGCVVCYFRQQEHGTLA